MSDTPAPACCGVAPASESAARPVPVGGWLPDRLGGYRLLVWLPGGFAVCLAGVAAGPPAVGAVVILFVGMGLLGMGNGAVFQLVPQRSRRRRGRAGGAARVSSSNTRPGREGRHSDRRIPGPSRPWPPGPDHSHGPRTPTSAASTPLRDRRGTAARRFRAREPQTGARTADRNIRKAAWPHCTHGRPRPATGSVISPAIGLEGQHDPDREQHHLPRQHEDRVPSALVGARRGEHPGQATDHEKPSHERDQHRPRRPSTDCARGRSTGRPRTIARQPGTPEEGLRWTRCHGSSLPMR